MRNGSCQLRSAVPQLVAYLLTLLDTVSALLLLLLLLASWFFAA